MNYSDKEICEKLIVGVNGLKKIRLALRQLGVIADRERINDKKMPLVKKIIDEQKESGANYDAVVKKVIDEEKRKRNNLLSTIQSVLEESEESLNIDIFHEVIAQQYPDPKETVDIFLEAFVVITDILRKIGDEDSAVMLEKSQGGIISKSNFKFLYQQGRIK